MVSIVLDAELVLDAIGEPNRRQLLRLLHAGRECTVSELVETSGLRQPQVSKHLKVLARASLVASRADGRFRHYRLDGRGLEAAHDWFASFEDVWQARFDALDELVSRPEGVAVPPGPHGRDAAPEPDSHPDADPGPNKETSHA